MKLSQVNATAVNVSWDVLTIPRVSIDNYTVVYSPYTKTTKRQDTETSVVYPAFATWGVIPSLNTADIYQFQVFASVTVNGTLLDGERSEPVTFSCK